MRARIARRQEGAGGRVLFDALLEREGIDPDSLRFCERPALTESDIAAVVADGKADCGLAIGAVAKLFGLDFVPLHRERFDIACRRRDHFEPALQALFAFTRSMAFAEKAAQLGCYRVGGTGQVRFNA
jgi:molybdate-binding protein